MTPPTLRAFFDTEFISGLATLDGRELYAELDMISAFGRATLAIPPRDVRDNVLDKFNALGSA